MEPLAAHYSPIRSVNNRRQGSVTSCFPFTRLAETRQADAADLLSATRR
jgi:hypothetical protein